MWQGFPSWYRNAQIGPPDVDDLVILSRELAETQQSIAKIDGDLDATVAKYDGWFQDVVTHINTIDGNLAAVSKAEGPRGERGESIVGPQGERGERGLPGERGEPGRAGADGKPALVWCGEWRPHKEYAPGDAVFHDGCSFICVVTTSEEPPADSWNLLAARGERGLRGPAGKPGKAGDSYVSVRHTTEKVDVADTGTVKTNLSGIYIDAGVVVRAVDGDGGFSFASFNSAGESKDILGITRTASFPNQTAVIQRAGFYPMPGLSEWAMCRLGDNGTIYTGAMTTSKYRAVIGYSVVGGLIIEVKEDGYFVEPTPPQDTVVAKNVSGPIAAFSPVEECSGEFILAKHSITGFALTASDLGDTITLRKAGDVVGDFAGVLVEGGALIQGSLYFLAIPTTDNPENRGKLTADTARQVCSVGRATAPDTLHIENVVIRPLMNPDWPDLLAE